MFYYRDGLDVKHNPNTRIPVPGDKVVLTDEFYETLTDSKEAIRLSKLPYITVSEAYPLTQGSDGVYEYVYPIHSDDTVYMIGTGYKFID